MGSKKKIRLTNPYHFCAVGFGSGLSPIIPGTMGSLAAIPIWYLFFKNLPESWYCFSLIVVFLLGIVFCNKTSRDLGCHDHGSIVWDEFVGMWMVLFFIPTANWQWILSAFILFRLFDMWKPWPIRWFDRHIKGGVGIMLDDIIAALAAIIVILFYLHF